MFAKILVPLDGSKPAQQALEVALSLAKTPQAEVIVCSIVDPVLVVGTTPPSPAIDLLLTDRENEARHIIDDAVEKARRAGIKARGEMHLGVPYDEILSLANRTKPDAIVMGTHGRTGVTRMLLGSVAESVLRAAPCPVIVVRETAPVTAIRESVIK